MVTLYSSGHQIGTLVDAEKLIPEFITKNQPIEFRDDAGNLVGTFLPKQRLIPPEPLIPWDPSITQADIDRIRKEPGFTFEEMKQRLGGE
jgi:hypothetical protein